MECRKVEELLVSYVEGQLSRAENNEVESHILSCKACSQALEETRTLITKLDDVQMKEPAESLRKSFYKMLSEEKQFQKDVRPITDKPTTSWKTAFQIAASIVFLLGGYLFGSFQEGKRSEDKFATMQMETESLKKDMMLALLDNKSASKRIQAVSYTSEMKSSADPKVIEALVDRLQFDGNVNVRLAAAEALANFSDNETVKAAFIKTLTNEKNPTVQIAVIQFLVDIQEDRARAPMQKLLEEAETPSYVKEQLNQGLQQLI